MKRLSQGTTAIAIVIAFVLTACGGGAAGSAGSAGSAGGGVPAMNPPTTTQGSARGVIVVVYPPTTLAQAPEASVLVRGSKGTRRPLYIAPSTVTAVWSATPQGSSTVAFSGVADLSSGSSLCVPTGSGGRTCTIPIYVNPGIYTVTLQTYDQAPVNGQVPNTAKLLATSSITTTIAQDARNSLAFVLSGIVGGVTATNGLGAATFFSAPGDGSAHQVGIGLAITDPDGNVITGSAPYASPIPVSLTETGGSGHMSLVVAGINVGSSGSIAKPSDTLAVQYDGRGSGAYHSTVSLGSTSPLSITVTPMYVVPASLSFTKLVQSQVVGITETGAPPSIAYVASPGVSCPLTTNGSTTGTGAADTATVAVNVAGGTNTSCSVSIADILGTTMAMPITYAMSGPITSGTVTGVNVAGSCASTLSFSGTGVVATQAMTDPGFTGPLIANSSDTSVVTVSVSGLSLMLTSVGPGTANVSISDPAGNTFTCATGVTVTGGTVS